MKAVILHGTNADHTHNWFPWLKTELEKLGYEVWVPDLPNADRPNTQTYNNFLLSSGWDFSNNLVIGHSSGAVEILGLLNVLPLAKKINTAILVGSFSHVLAEEADWEQLKGLFDEPFNFPDIKKKAKQFIFVHSNNDPYCPIEQAESLYKELGGEFVRFSDMGHFTESLDPRFNKFPELLDIIKEKVHFEASQTSATE